MTPATQPSIPWRQIARMRDHLAHRYFDTAHAILQATVDEDLPELERAAQALTARSDGGLCGGCFLGPAAVCRGPLS
jgi:uncharacterized protein with HEPN domain